MRSDRQVVLASVNKNSDALYYYASADLQSDREIVLAAVNYVYAGLALSYASAELQSSDREIVLAAAVTNDGRVGHWGVLRRSRHFDPTAKSFWLLSTPMLVVHF